MQPSRVLRIVGTLALVAGALGMVPGAAAADAPRSLELRATQALSPRLTELRLFSPAMGRETLVRVLVPSGFDPARDHLPVLWLLHGGFGRASDWTMVGHAEDLTAGLPLIVVMPDGGTGGWYADWRNATAEGPQRWETYHVDELRPFIESRYQTRTDRSGRAIAGLSMGGFGAIHDAARHPDLFGFAASFSGAVDILHPGVSGVVAASPLAHQGKPGDIFGERFTEETRWRAGNPVDLAANLRTVGLELRTGNGFPGGPHGGGPDIQEGGVSQANATLHARLDALGIAHLYDDYGPGAHTYDYWIDDLRATLPGIIAATATRRDDPTTVDHVAFEPRFHVWGFDVALDRPVLETATLSARPDGFDLRGSGAGTVTTPAHYRPGQPIRVTVTNGAAAPVTSVLAAGTDGRVSVSVDLGPANPTDQYPLASVAPVTQQTVHVQLDALPVAVEGARRAAPDGAGTLPTTGAGAPLWLGAALTALALALLRLRRTRATPAF
jgi:S-formylglutathione hydrolase FrmB